jgi:hypothetical protein
MTRHLSPEEISSWLAGDQDRALQSHLGQCPKCCDELRQSEEVLSRFGESVRVWSQGHLPVSPSRSFIRGQIATPFWLKAHAGVTIVTLLALLMSSRHWLSTQTVTKTHSAVETSPAVTDSALLAQLNRQLSTAVPESMEPLTELIVSDRQSRMEERNSGVRGIGQ